MALDLETVVKQLNDSGIVAPGKLENFVPPKAHPKTVEELVAELVKQNHLTPFQAQQVKVGKSKALILGAYTIINKIGAGGMGQVFKAEHRKMKRVVAIKMLPPSMMKDAAAAARFEREVEAAAKLRHPNIVAADDAAEANGVHFLVMEYVDGKDLSALVKKNGPFPVPKAVNCIVQAAKGLEFAHKKGVVHRDIKPGNLLLDNEGTVKILDMGLARIESTGDAATQAELTGTGTVMGTVDYMAPEQALNTKSADAKADIYSLGISLYYLIAGRAAYAGDSLMEKLVAHREQPIPSLQQVQTTVPMQLEVVFRKMVAKKIEDRYQSMTEVVAELEKCQATLTTAAASSTSAWNAPGTDKESDLSIAFAAGRMPSIPNNYEEPLPTARIEQSRTVGKKGPPGKNKKLLIGAGAAGFLFVLLGVIVIVRNKDGKEVAKVEVLDGHSVEVQPTTLNAQPTALASSVPAIRSAPATAKAPFDATQAKAHQAAWAKHLGTTVEQKNQVGMTLVLIPPGEFLMGSTDEQVLAALKVADELKINQAEKNRIQKAERPQHRVVITKPLLMSATEVTVGQFRKFVEATRYVTQAEQFGSGNSGATKPDDKTTPEMKKMTWRMPGYAVTDESPVSQITWNDACAYCAWLSEQEQRTPWYRADGKGGWLIAAQASGYRLPTEAEWEYACRAGTTTQYSFGDDYAELEQYGWYNKNAGGRAQPVALKLPNPFGLFDMHGNLYEWCQDFYDEKWYENLQPNDSKGPSSGPNRVIRGGDWDYYASRCRSAYRDYISLSFRGHIHGFRCVRVADATADFGLATGAATTQPLQPWNTPAFQQWMKTVAAMPAEKQIEAVAKKLVELNPAFDGKLTGADMNGPPKIEKGVVTELGVSTYNVTDISPLRALMGLKSLNVTSVMGSSKLSDLSPLEGMPLTNLGCVGTQVSDLSPLNGMKLTTLNCGATQVSNLLPLQGMPLLNLYCVTTKISDLSPLEGMPLTVLSCSSTQVSDLSPLRGMPLTWFACVSTQVSDLSPLQGMRLYQVIFTPKNIINGLDVIRQMKSLKTIAFGDGKKDLLPSDEFWKKYDAGEFGKPVPAKPITNINDPAFQAWMKTVAAMPAEKQIEAVSKKLMELNPGFDGEVRGFNGAGSPKIEGGLVTEFGFFIDNVMDISPVRALLGLKTLSCNGSEGGKRELSDLSPLRGMKLEKLSCCGNKKLSDLSPLQGMPLIDLAFGGTSVSDLSPVRGMKLTRLDCANTAVTSLLPLDGMPLTSFGCIGTQVADLSPLRGMPLTFLSCNSCPLVSDLSPLQGMPLTVLKCIATPLSDLSPLQECKSLKTLTVTKTKVTVAGVAALQKALPNCKIDWDDPAKPKTPEPAASGTK